jgi:hypothetical protein
MYAQNPPKCMVVTECAQWSICLRQSKRPTRLRLDLIACCSDRQRQKDRHSRLFLLVEYTYISMDHHYMWRKDECGGRYESVYALGFDPIDVCNHDLIM